MVDYKYLLQPLFANISDSLRYKFCPGYYLITYGGDPLTLAPKIDRDYDETKSLFTRVCDHLYCRCNANTEYDYYMFKLCAEGKLSPTQLNASRPLHWSESKHLLQRPNYSNRNHINSNSKCPNFRVILHNSNPIVHGGIVETVPCYHENNCCQYEAASLFTMATLQYTGAIPWEALTTIRNNLWSNKINDAIKGAKIVARAIPEIGDCHNFTSFVYLNQRFWQYKYANYILWPPNLLKKANDFSCRPMAPPLGFFQANYSLDQKFDEWDIPIPKAKTWDDYNEYNSVRAHFSSGMPQDNTTSADINSFNFEEFLETLNNYLQ